MKKSLSVLVFSLLSTTALLSEHPDKHELTVYQKDYRFSTVFEMESKGHAQGSAVKSVWRWFKPLRDTYDIYDEEGVWQATGIGRIWCSGFFRPWGAEFDVYDVKGKRIGVIDGQVFTTESAKFSFYNAEGKHVGTAYMDLKNAGFSILHPEKSSMILAYLRRNFVQDQTDHWTITINDETGMIDPRVLKVFTAFAVDKQGFFKEDI
jgi:uncharacterized protein YxjI